MNNLRPCRYPGCRGSDGNPTITTLGMCEHCQGRYGRLLEELADDWLTLHRDLPKPLLRANVVKVSTSKIYGHPAEWASDMAAKIASTMNELHNALADHLDSPPAPHPGTTERGRLKAAWQYLRHRISQLALYDDTGDLTEELIEVHQTVRNGLGHNRRREALPIPCPSCELKTVTRTADPFDDRITCEHCGFTITEERYPFFVRMCLEQYLDLEDTPETAVVA